MLNSDSARSDLTPRNSVARADENDEEVHAEDTGGRVVFEAQVDVLGDAEAEAAGGGEVCLF